MSGPGASSTEYLLTETIISCFLDSITWSTNTEIKMLCKMNLNQYHLEIDEALGEAAGKEDEMEHCWTPGTG